MEDERRRKEEERIENINYVNKGVFYLIMNIAGHIIIFFWALKGCMVLQKSGIGIIIRTLLNNITLGMRSTSRD